MKLDHPSDVCFKHSAISFGAPDMPPPDVGSSIGPISLHKAIGTSVNSRFRNSLVPHPTW